MSPGKKDIDWGLKFYLEVLKLDSLHFGLWEEDDPLTVEGMREAQSRYTRTLLSLIPPGVKRVLDAGCGTGSSDELLFKKGFEVTALNPDPYQGSIFKQRLGEKVPLKQIKFEDFKASGKYDLILMSESSQYMDTSKMSEKAYEVLKDGGYLLISDYFRKESGSKYYSTCKVKGKFMKTLSEAGFSLKSENNVSKKVLPTLILGRKIYEEYALPTIQIITGYISSNYPVAARIVRKLFSKKLKKVSRYLFQHTREKTETEKFFKKMEYLFLLFEKKSPV